MLPVSALLNQLTTTQQLAIETDLQLKVVYNSSTLSVFSSMLFGETKDEILESCSLDNNNYPRKERPIYQAILDFYGLKAENARDQFLAEVYFAIHEEKYESNAQKVTRLEGLFHQMKKFDLEEESAQLLHELVKKSLASPLHAVYAHLYNKYHTIEINNNKAYSAFEKLNLKISDYLGENLKQHSIRDLIKGYKEIRSIHKLNESRVSECILNLAMLSLVNYCGQVQLLKENKWSIKTLFETCKTQTDKLPFSVERMFVQNIFDNNLRYAILNKTINVDDLSFKHLKVERLNMNVYNFGFKITENTTSEKTSKREQIINNFVRNISTTTISIKQNTLFPSPHQI